MDYSYFTAGPQPYQWIPPTPHTVSANSDDFSNSPVRGVPLNLVSPISSHHSHSHYSIQHRPSPSSPRPPVSQPQYHDSHHFLTQKQDNFDQFQLNYDLTQFNNGAANGLPPQPKPPTPQSQHTPLDSSNRNGNHGYDMNMEINDEGTRRGSKSEDDDNNRLPAQARRQAQNRAAYVSSPYHPRPN